LDREAIGVTTAIRTNINRADGTTAAEIDEINKIKIIVIATEVIKTIAAGIETIAEEIETIVEEIETNVEEIETIVEEIETIAEEIETIAEEIETIAEERDTTVEEIESGETEPNEVTTGTIENIIIETAQQRSKRYYTDSCGAAVLEKVENVTQHLSN